MLVKIPGNVSQGSGECWQILREMLVKIPGNVNKDSREC